MPEEQLKKSSAEDSKSPEDPVIHSPCRNFLVGIAQLFSPREASAGESKVRQEGVCGEGDMSKPHRECFSFSEGPSESEKELGRVVGEINTLMKSVTENKVLIESEVRGMKESMLVESAAYSRENKKIRHKYPKKLLSSRSKSAASKEIILLGEVKDALSDALRLRSEAIKRMPLGSEGNSMTLADARYHLDEMSRFNLDVENHYDSFRMLSGKFIERNKCKEEILMSTA